MDLAEAMSRANNSAQMAGISMDKYIGYLTTMVDITQKSPESIGESMKTVFSRYQNVAAGKFTAAQSDIDKDTYNEEEWANLNDVETALRAVGIKIRSSVDTFRDFDEVAAEIGSNWDTYSNVQQSGIATALAGVRQRENLVTLFSNWDQVQKFEEIAANSYGTATEKMEAYTSGIEAAQKRVQVAMEKFAMDLNNTGAIEGFYNFLADFIKNIKTIAITVGILAAALKGNEIASLFGSVLYKLQGATLDFGNGISKIVSFPFMDAAERKGILNEKFQMLQQNEANSAINKAINKVNFVSVDERETERQRILATQRKLFGSSKQSKLALADLIGSTIKNGDNGEIASALFGANNLLTKNGYSDRATLLNMIQARMKNISGQDQVIQNEFGINSRIDDSAIDAINVMNQEKVQALSKEIFETNKSSGMTEKLAQQLASRIIAAEQLTQDEKKYGQVLKESEAQLRRQATLTRRSYLLSSAASIASPFAAAGLGTAASEKFGLSEEATAIAQTAGTMALSAASSQIPSWIATLARRFSMGPFVGIALTVTSILTGVWQLVKQGKEKKEIEKAQQNFKEKEEDYTKKTSLTNEVKRYEELAKGVDSYGNQFMLTDEEYKEFISLSNQLADAFPELITRVDAAGNSFIGMKGKVGTVKDGIDELIESTQKAADIALIGNSKENVNTNFKKVFDQAKKEQNANNSDIKDLREKNSVYQNWIDNLKKSLKTDTNISEDIKLTRLAQIEEYTNKIEKNNQKIQELENSSRKAIGSLSTYNDAIIRQNENIYSNLSDDAQSFFLTTTKNALKFTDITQYKDAGEYWDHVEETMNKVKQLAENEDFMKLYIGKAGFSTITDVKNSASDEIMNAIAQSLGGQYDGMEDILFSMGYKVILEKDGTQVLSKVDYTEELLKAMRLEDINTNSDIYKYWDNLINGMSFDEYARMRGYAQNGWINQNTSADVIHNIANNGFGAGNLARRVASYNNLVNNSEYSEGTISGRISDFYNSRFDENEGYVFTQEDVASQFSDLPETMWQAIWNGYETLRDGGVFEDVVADAAKNIKNATIEEQKGIAEEFSKKWFTRIETDGIIDSWKEIKDAMEDIRRTYEALEKAQQEQNYLGHLNIGTVLDLLAADENYINVLQVEKDETDGTVTGIKLKQDAEKELAKIKMMTLEMNLEAAIAEEEQTAEQIKAQMEEIVASGEYQQAVSDTVAANNVELESTANLTDAYYNLAGAIITAKKAKEYYEGNGEEPDISYTDSTAAADSAKGKTIEPSKVQVVDYEGTLNRLAEQYERLTGLHVSLDYDDAQGFYGIHYSDSGHAGTIDTKRGITEMLKTAIEKGDFESFKSIYDGLDGASSAVEDLLNAIDALIDKEWEAMQVWDGVNQKSTGYTEYFEKKSASLLDQIGYYEKMADTYSNDQAKSLEYQKKAQDLKKELANLDDEEVQDKIDLLLAKKATVRLTEAETEELKSQQKLLTAKSDTEQEYYEYLKKEVETLKDIYDEQYNLLELQSASVDALIAQQEKYIKELGTLKRADETSKLEAQKKLNELYEERRELAREVADYEKYIAEYNLDRLSGTAYSNKKDYDAQIKIIKDAIVTQEKSLQDSINAKVKQLTETYMETEGLSYAKALEKAGKNSDVIALMKEYWELTLEYGEIMMTSLNDKVDELKREIDKMGDERPKEWTSVKQIQDSFAAERTALQNQINLYTEALKDLSKLTDDQIIEITDGLNEATIALHEAKIQEKEDIKTLQEKQYGAVTAQIGLYKDEIQNAIDDIEDAYDKEYKKIRQNNEERERAVRLEDLLQAKKNAAEEKQRTYREGVGWIYEANRSSQKQAQEDLDNFYREDKLSDLEKTKDEEVYILQQRLKAWDDYLEALEWDYGEYERLYNLSLVEGMLGVKGEDAVRDALTGDMEKLQALTANSYTNYSTLATDFTGTMTQTLQNFQTMFQDFLNTYQKNLIDLQKLNEESLVLQGYQKSLKQNDELIGAYELIAGSGKGTIKKRDYLAEMIANSEEWYRLQDEISKTTDPVKLKELQDKQKSLHQTNLELSDYILSEDISKDQKSGNYFYTDGTKHTSKETGLSTSVAYVMIDGKGYSDIDSLISKFDENSKAWHTASQEEKKALEAANQAIGTALGWTYNSGSGTWSSTSSGVPTTVNNSGTTGRTSSNDNSISINTSSAGATGKTSYSGTSGNSDVEVTNSSFVYGIGSSAGKEIVSSMKSGDTVTLSDGTSLHKNSDGSLTATTSSGNTYKAETRANGIEGGPITYTGLAMLHGTPSAPEYVLNSDQAYNLLRNMATLRMPEYESKLVKQDTGTQYIVQGDIVLENCDNPEQFWNDVTKQMSNRWNVTKNR